MWCRGRPERPHRRGGRERVDGQPRGSGRRQRWSPRRIHGGTATHSSVRTPARSPWSWCPTWRAGRTKNARRDSRRSFRVAEPGARIVMLVTHKRGLPWSSASAQRAGARSGVAPVHAGRRRGRARTGQHGRRGVLRRKKTSVRTEAFGPRTGPISSKSDVSPRPR